MGPGEILPAVDGPTATAGSRRRLPGNGQPVAPADPFQAPGNRFLDPAQLLLISGFGAEFQGFARGVQVQRPAPPKSMTPSGPEISGAGGMGAAPPSP